MKHKLYFSADDLRNALSELGPTGTKAEGLVATAIRTLADLIEDDGLWQIWVAASPPDALQGARPVVEIHQRADDA